MGLLNKKKIAILGACCSRDIFNKKFVPDWRDFFDVVFYQFQPTFISLMSCPIPYSRSLDKKYSENVTFDNMLKDECIKDTYNSLLSVNPEIIMIDFYSDVINGVIPINDYSYISERQKEWDENAIFLSMKKGMILNPSKNPETYFELWKKGFDFFMRFVKKYLPYTLIVINSARCTNIVKNDDGSTYIHKFGSDVILLNRIWSKMDDYASDNYSDIIRIENEKEYYLTPNYIFGFMWIVHYCKDYYEDRFSKLTEISVNKKNTEMIKKQIYPYNLLFNGNCSLYTLYWIFWSDHFKIVETREHESSDYSPVRSTGEKRLFITYRSTSAEKKRWAQCWTAYVETSGLGEDEYIISFDCRINDLSLLEEEKIIFAVRTYDKKGFVAKKDSVQNIMIAASPEAKEKEWSHYNIRIKPEGKYISVGPFIAKNGDVMWKNIQISRYTNRRTDDYVSSVSEQLLINDEDVLIDINRNQITNLKQLALH